MGWTCAVKRADKIQKMAKSWDLFKGLCFASTGFIERRKSKQGPGIQVSFANRKRGMSAEGRKRV